MEDKTAFETALEIHKQKSALLLQKHREDILRRLMTVIGSYHVECPYCKTVQKTTSYKAKKCVACGRSFTIFMKNKRSRVADTPENRRKRHLIQQLSSVVLRAKYTVV